MNRVSQLEFMTQNNRSIDSDTFLMMSVEKSSWVLPLISIFLFSLVDFKKLSPLLTLGATCLLFVSAVVGFTFGLKGIRKVKSIGRESLHVQSKIGMFLNFLVVIFLIAVLMPVITPR
jgi:hypothetical protein